MAVTDDKSNSPFKIEVIASNGTLSLGYFLLN